MCLEGVRCVLKAVAFMRLWGQVCLERCLVCLERCQVFLDMCCFLRLCGQVCLEGSPVCLQMCRFHEALGAGVS